MNHTDELVVDNDISIKALTSSEVDSTYVILIHTIHGDRTRISLFVTPLTRRNLLKYGGVRIPRIRCQETVRKSTAQPGSIWHQLTSNFGMSLVVGAFSPMKKGEAFLKCVETP